MTKTKTSKLIAYIVSHNNGKEYNIFLPKMSEAKTRAAMEMDAKSDDTTLKSYRIDRSGNYF